MGERYQTSVGACCLTDPLYNLVQGTYLAEDRGFELNLRRDQMRALDVRYSRGLRARSVFAAIACVGLFLLRVRPLP